MPDDMEVLGFSLEFTTKTKELENLKKLLDGTLKDISATMIAIKKLNQLFAAWSGLSTINKNKGNTEEANRYKEMAKNAKSFRDALKIKLDAEKALASAPKLPEPHKEKLGEKVFDSDGGVPKITLDKPVSGDLFKRVITETKSGEVIDEFTREISETADSIVETIVKSRKDSVLSTTTEKYKKKSTYDASTFDGLGTVVSTKVDELTKAVIQTTEERIGDLIIKRVYKDGVLDKTTTYYKPRKEKILPKGSGEEKVTPDSKDFLDKDKKTKTSFSKFMARVKNIVLYRIVRVAMSAIGKGINEGFTLLGTSNQVYKDIIIDFKTASTSLSVTFAQLLAPAASILASSLRDITSNLLESANAMAINEARAKGETKYFKLSQEAIDEYSKSLVNATKSLTQIDKFATLSENKPVLGTWEEITDETVKNAKEYSGTLNTISAIAKNLADFFKGIAWFIKKIQGLSKEWKIVLGTGVVGAIIAIGVACNPILAIVTTIITATNSLRKVWESDIPTAFKVATTAAISLAAVLAVIAALMPGGKTKVVLALGAGGAALAALGNYSVGTLFAPSQPDTGSAQTQNSSLNKYTNSLDSNVITDTDLTTPQVTTSTSDVYLDSDKVGKSITKTVIKYSAKSGY